MPEFLEVLHALFDLDKLVNGQMEWTTPASGVVEIKLYVGVENTDMLKSAREMFAPLGD